MQKLRLFNTLEKVLSLNLTDIHQLERVKLEAKQVHNCQPNG